MPEPARAHNIALDASATETGNLTAHFVII
jgi:hypothetical protein